MSTFLLLVFVVGYLTIALEHPLKINKTASALFLGIACWTIYVTAWDQAVTIPEWFSLREGPHASPSVTDFKLHGQLEELVSEIAGLLFFLMGAMLIVEIVDANEGFALITRRVGAPGVRRLMWIVSWLTFFLSSVLDNLTTTIVMVSLLRKLVPNADLRRLYVGIVVIAANAGGAWTPIGDVTTTMLWMDGKVTPGQVITNLIGPSALCLLIPLCILSFTLKQESEAARARNSIPSDPTGFTPTTTRQLVFLGLGLLGLLSVPVFKTLTHMPPFMGMLASVSVIWLVSELMDRHMSEDVRTSTGVVAILRRIDLPSLLFFLGILLAVGALGACGILRQVAAVLDENLGNPDLFAFIIGLLSAIVDNVPLVAAGMNMYALPDGDPFWLALAYCAGTGGSCLIIGSASGVAAMGLEKIDFLWYVRKISPLALAGYVGGMAAYLLL